MPPVTRRSSTGIRRPRVAGRSSAAREAGTEVLEPPLKRTKPRSAPPTSPDVDDVELADVETTEAAETAETSDVEERPATVAPESDEQAGDADTVAAVVEKPAARPQGRRTKVGLRKETAAAMPAGTKPGRKPTAKQKAAAKPTIGSRLRTLVAAPVSTRAVALYGIVALVLVGAAAFFGMSWYNLTYTGAAANRALVDIGATAEVSQQVTEDLKTIYSFDYTRLDQNEKDAEAVITPAFQQQFQQIFADVRNRAPQQQAVVTATIPMSAVREIDGDHAVLVVFMDQIATRVADTTGKQQLASAGRLTVTAQNVDGRWKIADVKAL